MPKQDIIKYDPDQKAPIQLDLTTNQIIFSPEVDQILSQSKDIVEKGNQIAQTDINQIDEKQMTALNKEIRPISKVQKQYLDTRKSIKKQLQNRDDEILNAFDQKLNENHFDEIESVVKKLRALQKDFKANRANQRWDQVQKYFDEQMQLYPELAKYAKNTLANFTYYRLHHADLVSEAKTKPVNQETIQTLNQDLYNYHNDLKHLFDSSLNGNYYQDIIDQYADDPSTNQMLNLIKQYNVQQLKDQNVQVEYQADQLIDQLWMRNPKINQKFDELRPTDFDPTKYQATKKELMQEQIEAIKANIDLTTEPNTLNDQIKNQIKHVFVTIADKLKHLKPIKVAPAQNDATNTDPHQWLIEYLQVKNWANVHNDDRIKALILKDLFTTVSDPSSIWHEHIKNNHALIELTQYIINL